MTKLLRFFRVFAATAIIWGVLAGPTVSSAQPVPGPGGGGYPAHGPGR